MIDETNTRFIDQKDEYTIFDDSEWSVYIIGFRKQPNRDNTLSHWNNLLINGASIG